MSKKKRVWLVGVWDGNCGIYHNSHQLLNDDMSSTRNEGFGLQWRPSQYLSREHNGSRTSRQIILGTLYFFCFQASVASHPYPFVSVIVFWSNHRKLVFEPRRFFICFLFLLKMIWGKKSIPQQNWWPGCKDRGWSPGVFLVFCIFMNIRRKKQKSQVGL